MSTSPPAPPALLRDLVASDPGRPRVTVYDDTDTPTRGERIELSARVLANWVAKAANLLRDDLDAGPGSTVLLDLPPHWRTLYWAFAAWSVGACVEVPARRTLDAGAAPAADGDAGAPPAADEGAGAAPAADGDPAVVSAGADVVVTDAVEVASAADEAVLVTLAALARSAPVGVPAGVVDEARELATHGDVFDAWDEPAAADPALRTGGDVTAYGDLPARRGSVDAGADRATDRVHTMTTDTAQFLLLALATFAADGSVVLSRGRPEPGTLAARLTSEGVTSTR